MFIFADRLLTQDSSILCKLLTTKVMDILCRIICVFLVAASLAVPRCAEAAELRASNYHYTGGVKNGKQNGYGICRYNNGNVYCGHWKMGYKDGLGRMDFADGTIEFGTWKQGIFQNPKGKKFVAGKKVYGIDVSKYQKKIDWTRLQLNADASGNVVAGSGRNVRFRQPVLFALMKSTQGTTIVDPTFRYNFSEAKRAGIIRGAYHFLSISSSAREQAEYFIANTPLEEGDFPPVLDLEIPKKVMAKNHAKVIRIAKEWLRIVEEHYGVRPIIYTYNNYYIDYLKGHGLDDYDYWIARYGNKPSVRHWEIWQFTETGKCKGINHNVDINLFRGNYRDLKKYVEKNGIGKKAVRGRRSNNR